jgi:hypothetical protein
MVKVCGVVFAVAATRRTMDDELPVPVIWAKVVAPEDPGRVMDPALEVTLRSAVSIGSDLSLEFVFSGQLQLMSPYEYPFLEKEWHRNTQCNWLLSAPRSRNSPTQRR